MYELPPQSFAQTLPEGSSMDARTLISEVIRKSSVTCSDNTPLADIDGWDSLRGVRLVLRLEQIVGRELSEADIEGLQSVGDVERLLKSGA
jgi:acyl carrier protein